MKRKLKLLFLFLTVALSSLGFTYGLQNAEKLKHGICGENPVQGLVHMKFGYDLSSFTIKNFINAKRDEIFTYTCKHNASVHHYDKKYNYPDQFAPPLLDGKKKIDKTAKFTSHFEDFVREEETGIKTDEKSDIFNNLADNIPDMPNCKIDIKSIIKIVGNVVDYLEPIKPHTLSRFSKYSKTSEFRLSLNLNLAQYELAYKNPRKLLLDDAFIEDYKALPSSFLNDPKPFMSFIERYGTHYMYKAQFGGRITFYQTDNKSMLKTKTKEQLEQEYKMWITGYMDKTTESNDEEDEKQLAKLKAEVVGGDVSKAVEPFNADNIGSWEESVRESPGLMGASLVPIIDLIPIDSVKIELAQAILYRINKQTEKRYRELTKSIDESHLPDPLPNETIGDYKKRFNEVDESIRVASANTESILFKINKKLGHKVNKLSLVYQSIFAIKNLWEQMKKYQEVRKAVICIHNIVIQDELASTKEENRWFRNHTAFDNTDFYDDKYKYAENFITLYKNRVHEEEILNKVNKLFYMFKEANDFYLSLRTSDCNSLGEGVKHRARHECFRFVLCGVKRYMAEWNQELPLDTYENTYTSLKYLKTMLTTMQHKELWEATRVYFMGFPAETRWGECPYWKKYVPDPN